MGGIPQLLDLLAIAAAVLAGMLLAAFLVGRLFQSKKIRKRIFLSALAIYLIAFVGYFGFIAFILSGNLN